MVRHYGKRSKLDLSSVSGDEKGPGLTPMMVLRHIKRSKLELKSSFGDEKGPSWTP